MEGVPDHLEHPLREWIRRAVTEAVNDGFRNPFEEFAQLLAVRLRLLPVKSNSGWNPYLVALISVDRKDLLRVVNCILQLAPDADLDLPWVRPLVLQLRLGSSAYEVADVDGLRLVRRLDPAIRDHAAKVMAEADTSPGAYLRQAYVAVYGLEPDPDRAYADAVRAVEAAAVPVVVPPTASKPTLGTVLSALANDLLATTPSWQLLLPDQTGAPTTVRVLKEMIEVLWHGHRSRHAGGASSRANTQEEAEAAIALAMTLVYWLSKNVLQRRP